MAVFEVKTTNGNLIGFRHEADSVAALLGTLAVDRFMVGQQVASSRDRGRGEAAPVGITFHSVAEVRLQPEPGVNRDREVIEHHALEEYRENG